MIPKVFFVIHNHTPMQEGEKVRLGLTTETLPNDPTIPPPIRDYWIKVIVEKRGRITHHILLGEKGDCKKVHIFSRPNEPATFENTPEHLPAEVLPFRQIGGVVVKDGSTYSYRINRDTTRPNKQGSPKKI